MLLRTRSRCLGLAAHRYLYDLYQCHTKTMSDAFREGIPKACNYLQRRWSGTQASLSPCIVRVQHAQDCSQSTGTLISLTLPHSFPLNTSHHVYHDVIGILDMLQYNSSVTSLPSTMSHISLSLQRCRDL